MRDLLLLSIFAALLSTTACTKKNTIANVPGPKIKTIATNSAPVNNTDTFFYNIDGTLQRFAHSSGGFSIFTYSSNTVVEYQYDHSAILLSSILYYLDVTGLADSAKVATGSPATYTYRKYLYDSDRHLLAERIYDGSGMLNFIYDYTYTGGNAVTYVYTDGIGNVAGGQTTTYNMSLNNTIGNNNTGQPYFGASSVNVPSQAVQTTTGVARKYYWAYTLDSRSLISTSTQTDTTTGATVSTTTYTYY